MCYNNHINSTRIQSIASMALMVFLDEQQNKGKYLPPHQCTTENGHPQHPTTITTITLLTTTTVTP